MLEKIITFINADAGTMATAIAKMTLFIVLSLRSLPQRPRFSLYIPRSAMSGRVLFRFCFEKKIRSWGLGASSSSKRGLCKASNLRTSKFWFVLGLRCSRVPSCRSCALAWEAIIGYSRAQQKMQMQIPGEFSSTPTREGMLDWFAPLALRVVSPCPPVCTF